jgi:hypothetical protein
MNYKCSACEADLSSNFEMNVFNTLAWQMSKVTTVNKPRKDGYAYNEGDKKRHAATNNTCWRVRIRHVHMHSFTCLNLSIVS